MSKIIIVSSPEPNVQRRIMNKFMVQPWVDDRIRKEIERCKVDPVYWAEHYLRTPNGDPIKLNEIQKEYLRRLDKKYKQTKQL